MRQLSQEAKTRVQAFDTIVDKNAQVLANPHVIKVLGSYASTLSAINQQFFLPNIRGSSIQLPKGHQMDNNAALLPILPSDPNRGLRYTLPMLLPGEEQLDRAAQRIASGPLGFTESDALGSVVEAMMALRTQGVQNTLDAHLKEVADTRERGIFPSSGTIGSYIVMKDEQDILYGRQMVVVPSELAKYSAPAVASVSLHEALHVEDHNNMKFDDFSDANYRYRKELRGIHVGALILECMIDELHSEDMPVIDSTLYVEALRKRSKEGTNEPPFTANAALIAHFAASDQWYG
jgi:hypothetical protein